jgi:hypothetical protein
MRVNIDDIVRDQAEYVMYDGKEYTGEVVDRGRRHGREPEHLCGRA